MIRLALASLLLLSLAFPLFAQHDPHLPAENTAQAHAKESHCPHWRIAVLMGHTLIPEEEAGEYFFIPSWGLDLEYWPLKRWGIGLHNDIEIETFVIQSADETTEDLDRVYPLVSTLDLLFRPWKGLVLQLGPGVEWERQQSFALMRAGIEYEIDFGHHWDICPSVFYDTRFTEYQTWSLAMGIGKRF